MNNERNPSVESIYLGAVQASNASVSVPGLYFRKRSRIKNVWLADQAGVTATGNTTDYFTLTLQDNAATPVAYASVTTSGTSVAALTQLAGTLQAGGGKAIGPTDTTGLDSDSASQLEVDVPAGTMLNVNVVGTSSAQHKVLTNAVMIVEWYPL